MLDDPGATSFGWQKEKTIPLGTTSSGERPSDHLTGEGLENWKLASSFWSSKQSEEELLRCRGSVVVVIDDDVREIGGDAEISFVWPKSKVGIAFKGRLALEVAKKLGKGSASTSAVVFWRSGSLTFVRIFPLLVIDGAGTLKLLEGDVAGCDKEVEEANGLMTLFPSLTAGKGRSILGFVGRKALAPNETGLLVKDSPRFF